jgi:hypothetical protein
MLGMIRAQSEADQDTIAAKSGKSTIEFRAAILCSLVLVLEGYGLGAMAFTLPALSDAWHLKAVAFTQALTAGSLGFFLGSLICGVLGDRSTFMDLCSLQSAEIAIRFTTWRSNRSLGMLSNSRNRIMRLPIPQNFTLCLRRPLSGYGWYRAEAGTVSDAAGYNKLQKGPIV